ncbi:23S rRNA-specific endonuclease VapC20 [Neomoorella glycerini]|uniref:23S rRNA-specific endonuclease VapC20 n=1 Tax=Neomoorella glycerini TaxID=55779 RepID=A0A6I5ZRZ6_9FIRM|nr:PIN domain-containing protein [Moorella glycerini]QGP92783.1 23S rRNA-specific endonuclease VapC20 [Moorella glycerini]
MQQQQGGKKELLFIATSAWIALYDQDDAFHKDAVSFFTPDNLRARKLIPVTTNFIFDEVYTYFCRNHSAAVTIGQSLKASKILKLLRIEEADEAKAWEIAQKYADKDFSYTDCTSFAVMQRLNCHKAFAFDNHFRQMGFEVFPAAHG